MIFENQIIKRDVTVNETKLTLKDYCTFAGLQNLNFKTTDDIEESVRVVAKDILFHYTKYSDVIDFLTTALNCRIPILRYKLTPPHTTSKLDCEHIFNMLAKIHVLHDSSYSSISYSFLLEVNPTNAFSVSELLNIGMCEILKDISSENSETVYDVTLCSEKGIKHADILYLSKDKTPTVLHIETAISIEGNNPFHSNNLKKLKLKIFGTNKNTAYNINEFFIVTPYVARLLPPSKKIITVDTIQDSVKTLLK